MQNVLVMMQVTEQDQRDLEKMNAYHFTYSDRKSTTDEQLADAEIIIGMPSMEQIRKAPKLTWIQTPSAGTDMYRDLPESIRLSNAYGVYGPFIAEYMVGCVFLVAKQWPQYMHQQRERQWKENGALQQIRGMKVLSVGMGSIGSEFLKRMHALGAECYGVRRTVHDQPDYVKELRPTSDFDDLLGEMDAVALSMPETPETIHLFNEERMRKMKQSAILINVGRGSAIDTDALLKMTDQGWFSGVCLDVLDPEPLPLNHPLWTMPQVHITPHISGRYYVNGIQQAVMGLIKENLQLAAEGKDPVHQVNHSLGY